MTKHPGPAILEADRPALTEFHDDTRSLSGSGSFIAGKSAREQIDRFCDCLRQIQQSWDNRLSAKKATLWENYINGDLSFVLIFYRFVAGDDDVVISRKYAAAELLPVNRNKRPLYFCDADRRYDKSVLINIVQLVKGPQSAVTVLVGLNFIEDKPLGFGEGLLYRRLGNGIYEVLPSFLEREISERVSLNTSAEQCRPDVIEGASQVVNAIADCQGQRVIKCVEVGSEKAIGSLVVSRDGRHVSFCANDLGKEMFDLVEVAVGPFDL